MAISAWLRNTTTNAVCKVEQRAHVSKSERRIRDGLQATGGTIESIAGIQNVDASAINRPAAKGAPRRHRTKPPRMSGMAKNSVTTSTLCTPHKVTAKTRVATVHAPICALRKSTAKSTIEQTLMAASRLQRTQHRTVRRAWNHALHRSEA